jgi:hypothetical protein
LAACLTAYVLLCISFLSVAAAEAPDLVTNGSFETGDSTGWNPFNTAEVVDTAPHSGNYCAKVGKNSSYEQTVALAPKTNYVLTGWAKTENGAVMTLGVKNYGGSEFFSTTVSAE